MEPIRLLPENYILLGRKKVDLTYRWLFLNEQNDLIREKKKKERKRDFMQSGLPRKEVPKGSLYIICNNLSFDSYQCFCLTMGSM